MLLRLLSAERCKLKRSVLWFAVFLIPMIPSFLGTANYLQNTAILSEGWYSLWTQVSLFYCYFFLPALIAIYCSYVCRLEHLNHNWNTVMTMPTKISAFFCSKLLTVSILLVITQAILGILYYICGSLIPMKGHFPLSSFLSWFFFGTLGGIAVAALQLCLSLIIRSFAVPVGIALIGGISGLLFISVDMGICSPYSLLAIGMNANSPSESLAYPPVILFLAVFGYLMLFSVFGIQWNRRRDVKSE